LVLGHRAQIEKAADEATRLAPQRELAWQAKAAKRLQHESDIAAGWPPSWKTTTVQRWSGLGGTMAQAVEFAAAGWRADATLAAAKASLIKLRKCDTKSDAEQLRAESACWLDW